MMKQEMAALAARLVGVARVTPLVSFKAQDFGLEGEFEVDLKLELMQRSGSFKARGALANFMLREVPPSGVAAASGGNHGAAVADAARHFGKPATIFVPEIASPAKIERIRKFGAELVVDGGQYADALANCMAFCDRTGAVNLHAYEQRETILGQGTLGFELEQQYAAGKRRPDRIVVAVGGGGLIGGLAAWFEEGPEIIGVEPETSCALDAALKAGGPVDVEVSGIAADSLGARRIGDLNYEIIARRGIRPIRVSDHDIREAQNRLWSACRIVAEPGGAAALAALTSGKLVPAPGETVLVIVCGANTQAVDFEMS